MVKEIDVGASQIGIEILTNKGSKDNPTKSVEIQKPPEKPYTITEHSKMFESMGKPSAAIIAAGIASVLGTDYAYKS